MIIACARRKRQARADRLRVVAALFCALFWVAWRDVAGEPAQPSHTFGIEHAGGTIAIHDRAPELHLGPRLSAAAATAARELPVRLGVGLPSSVAVLIAGDAPTFAAAAGRDPRWLLGVARPQSGLVVLNAARLGPGPEAAAEAVLRHELAHLALAEAEARSGPLPRWFDEGAASWFAGGTAEQGPVDLALAAGAPGLSLAQLTPSFPEDPRAAAQAYAKSQLAVTMLAARIRERGGEENLYPLGAALLAGTGFDAALLATTGFDLPGLEHALRERLLRRELGGALLRQAEWGLGLAMAILVGIAYLRYRLRLRRRLATWGREEAGSEASEGGESGGSSAPGQPPD
jgi:Peptidase MA superfamily